MANLVGAGEASRNSALCSRTSLSCQVRAVSKSPARHALRKAAQAPGATFEVTEMQPCPPWAM